EQMEVFGFMESTRGYYVTLFHKLCRMAEERGDTHYTIELGQSFISDDSHIIPENTKRYHHDRTIAYSRCIKFVESYIKDGMVDFSTAYNSASFPINSDILQDAFARYVNELEERKLKLNTIDGYRRFTYYFIEYLESKGYHSLSDIVCGDIVSFVAVVCSEKYQATSLGAHMPGLKIFLGMHQQTKQFLCEIPEHLPKKRDILKVYSDDEYNKIIDRISESDDISFRNRAITLLALNTGLRAVDICAIRLGDIDWEHDCIHIIQQKTGRCHDIPLTEAIGNALVDYLINERPQSNSDIIFLRSQAPFAPLMSHAGIRGILFNVVNDSDIEAKGRIYGTRITRHSAASRMLRKGIPLPVISEMLGHGSKDSVMIYITTDDAKLAECTLALPKGGGHND
ncbi:MAG: tyrosine-type recombinase/integrase, partial [Aeriscardovia sp.]|nr:tyrosine-type recombinase/integrase [Aeriscardovia sp.]